MRRNKREVSKGIYDTRAILSPASVHDGLNGGIASLPWKFLIYEAYDARYFHSGKSHMRDVISRIVAGRASLYYAL